MPAKAIDSAKVGAVVVIALALAGSHAFSQTPAMHSDAAPAETFVVTGHRPSAEHLDTVVWNYVFAHGKMSSKIDQLTRWIDPVCPVVRNPPPGFDQFISARIKAIAASVGAPSKVPCRPNIEIIFTAQPQTVMDGVAEHDPILLGYHFVHGKRDAAKVTQPIQAWYVTATTNGMQTYTDDPYHGTPGGAAGSRLSHGLQSVFSHILILANTDKIAGYPVGPIADYIAMLALSQAKAEDNCTEFSSIMDLMSSDCADADKPASLTFSDKAYLEGLYAMKPTLIGSLQRSSISEHMVRSLNGQ